jgi:hypothetical protein
LKPSSFVPKLDTQPTLWGKTNTERWGTLNEATHKLNAQFIRAEKPALMTDTKLALRQWIMRVKIRNQNARLCHSAKW